MSDFKDDWLSHHLQCPACGKSSFQTADTDMICQGCGTAFRRTGKAWNFITEAFEADFNIKPNAKASDHAYNTTAMEMLRACFDAGGQALDCGAGSRSFVSEQLIQTEIMAYDNIDILCVAQKLPFVDDAFDLIFSFDVLEHVTDPFACASEIARVLKPGGRLYIDLPFMQVEHGYPHHYFNATRMGLRRLFDGHLDVEAHIVPPSGHPAHVVWMALHTYRMGLSAEARAVFETMSVKDLIENGWQNLRDTPGGELTEAIRWKLASTTQAIFRKPGSGPMASRVEIDPLSLPNFQACKSLIS